MVVQNTLHFSLLRLILRIEAENPNDDLQFGLKFGCSVDEGERLLNVAKKLQLDVIGLR